MPVDPAYQLRDGDLVLIGHIVVADRVDIYDIIELFLARQAHRRTAAAQQYILLGSVGNVHRVLALDDLQRSALEQVDRIFSVVRYVYRELRVDGVIVFSLNASEHSPHAVHQLLVPDKSSARDKPH